LNAAITKELRDVGPIVTKWLILGEIIDNDGDSRLFHISSQGCHADSQLGMCIAHLQRRANEDLMRMMQGER
jgi:hypothetical protein